MAVSCHRMLAACDGDTDAEPVSFCEERQNEEKSINGEVMVAKIVPKGVCAF